MKATFLIVGTLAAAGSMCLKTRYASLACAEAAMFPVFT